MLGQGSLIRNCLVLAVLVGGIAGCSSNQKKYSQRDKIASSTGLYCDFINGDKHKEVELELNLSMARKCDPEKPYSISGYRNSSEVNGMLYCCSIKRATASSKAQPVIDKKPATPQDDKSSAETETAPL